MPRTTANEHLKKLADWQKENGPGVPPVLWDKKLSNWIQYYRTIGRRGRLDPEIAAAFEKLGISIERGATDAVLAAAADPDRDPRGFIPIMASTLSFMRDRRAAPSLSSEVLTERHHGSWLVRLQAGLLPANSFGYTGPADDQFRPEQVLEEAATVQTSFDMVSEWLMWCARTQFVFDRPDPGNNWHEAVYRISPQGIRRRVPYLIDAAERVRRGDRLHATEIPDPRAMFTTLSLQLASAQRAVKRVSFSKESLYERPLFRAIEFVTSTKSGARRAAPSAIHSVPR